MILEKHKQLVKKTGVYPETLRVIYPTLGLAGETGEVCEKIKKVYRDRNGVFDKETIENIKLELGDVLWYVGAICRDLGIDIIDVYQKNIDKLESRFERNKIHGEGDNR